MVKKSVIFGTVAVLAIAIIVGVTLTVTRKDDDDPKKEEESNKSVGDSNAIAADSESVGSTSTPTAPPTIAKSVGPTLSVSSTPSAGPTGTLVWNRIGNEIFGGPLVDNYSPIVEITNGGKQLWMTGFGSLKMVEFDSNQAKWFVRQDLSDEVKSSFVFSLGTTPDGKSIIVGLPTEAMAMVFTNDDLYGVNSTWASRGPPIKGEDSMFFGAAVDITHEGNMVAVADGMEAMTKILKYQGDEWVLSYNVVQDDGTGSAVALDADGSHLVVGNQFFTKEVGAVFVYTITPTKMTLVQRISGERPTDGFGADLSLSHDGSVLAVGTNSNLNNNVGSANFVNVYKRTMRDDDGYYEQVGGKIRQGSTRNFGLSVSLSGSGHRLAVGAMSGSTTGGFGITAMFGRAFIYSIQDNDWNLVGEFFTHCPGYENSVQVWLSEDGKRAAFGTVGSNDRGEIVGSVTVHEATPSD